MHFHCENPLETKNWDPGDLIDSLGTEDVKRAGLKIYHGFNPSTHSHPPHALCP